MLYTREVGRGLVGGFDARRLELRVLLDQLAPDRIRLIERRMRPGRFSESGFLDPSDDLVEVVDRDRRTLKSLRITPKQIGDRLESLVGQASRIVEVLHREADDLEAPWRAWYEGVPVGESFEVKRQAYMGYQECPFEWSAGVQCEESSLADCDFVVTDTDSRKSLYFPGLAIHLIRDHHFFEGAVRYRVDPAAAVSVLRLERERDYSPCWATEWIWSQAGHWQTIQDLREARSRRPKDSALLRAYRDALDDPETVVPLGDGQLFVKGDHCVAVPGVQRQIRGGFEVAGATWTSRYLASGVTAYERIADRYVETMAP